MPKVTSAKLKVGTRKSAKKTRIKIAVVEDEGTTLTAVVSKIAKRYGVRVASKPQPVENPYAMTAPQAAKAAQRAGILTSSGKLATAFH